MARKTETVTIDRPGRDLGKVFLLREMPASRVERWGIRAFMALAKAGVEVPGDVADAGLAGVAAIGDDALARIPYEDAEPLLEELMQCVSIIPDPSRPQVVRALIEDDIEEVATRLRLKMEVYRLHVGFSPAAGPLDSGTATQPPAALPNTPTSAP